MKTLKLLPLLLLLISCKKTEIPESVSDTTSSDGIQTGMPEDINSINGYMYASYNGSDKNNRRLYFYAAFGDPARGLTAGLNHYNNQVVDIGSNRGNVSVGNSISFSNYSSYLYLSGSSTASNSSAYYGNNSINVGNQISFANWKYNGNKSFKAMDVFVPRSFPKVNDSLIKNFDTLTISKGYTVKTENLFSNYDSLTVSIERASAQSILVKKTFAGGVPVVFTSSELSNLFPGNYVNIWFKAFNYSNQTVEGKKLVYELSGVTDRKTLILKP